MKNLLIGILLATLGLLLAACGAVIDSEGFKVGNPRDFAEATHIARLSEEAAQATAQAVSIEATKQTASIRAEATRQAAYVQAQATEQAANVIAQATESAIQHQAQQAAADKIRAQATVALAQARTEQDAQPAALVGKALSYFGLGVGALVLAVGLAFGIVAWVNKRATSVYPDARGQFPVIVRHGLGWVAFHDPNRALGSATVARTPTMLDALAGVAIATVKALKTGKTPSLPVAEPSTAFPLPGSESAMLQVATQEQAAQVRIAETANRPKLIVAVDTNPSQARQTARGRMPAVTVVNDPKQVEAFEQKLLEAGDE